MQQSVTDLLKIYLEEASLEGFERLREAVAASPDYAPYSDNPQKVLSEVPAGDTTKAWKALQPLMTGWILNPGIHYALSYIFDKQGFEKGAGFELALAERCLKGILMSGNGKKESPFLVLYPADEYDVLESLNKKSAKQTLVKTPELQAFDVHTCEDGTELWFDITTPYKHLATSLKVSGNN